MLCCARCSGSVPVKRSDTTAPEGPVAETTTVTDWRTQEEPFWNNEPLCELLDEWKLQDDSHAAKRLRRNVCGERKDKSTANSSGVETDSGATLHGASVSMNSLPDSEPVTEGARKFVAWSVVYLGLVALICGATLTAWAYLEGRAELWLVGVPTAVLGQIALMLGLIVQLDGLWQSHRKSRRTFAVLDDRLSNLRQSSMILNAPHAKAYLASHVPPPAKGDAPLDLRQEIERLSAKVVADQ